MFKLLMWISREYNNPTIFVTENGVSDRGAINDYNRIDYFNAYLEAVLDAIDHGANVMGYIAWSLMDSYEWKAGFSEKFGLYHVDFNDPKRTRTPKASALAYARIASTNQIDWNYRPKVKDISRVERHSANSAMITNRFNLFVLVNSVIILMFCKLLILR